MEAGVVVEGRAGAGGGGERSGSFGESVSLLSPISCVALTLSLEGFKPETFSKSLLTCTDSALHEAKVERSSVSVERSTGAEIGLTFFEACLFLFLGGSDWLRDGD